MKKYLILIPTLVLVAFPVSAAEFVGSDKTGYAVPAGSTVAEDLYVGAKHVDIAGTVNADINAAGETVTVGGSVQRDVIAGGRMITVSGSVGDNVRVAGQTITVSGAIHGDVVAFGETLTIAQGSVIDGDVLFFGKTLTIAGEVKGEVHVWSAEVALVGAKTGAVTAHTGDFSLTNATITGDVTYYSDTELSKDASTTITGAVKRVPLPPMRTPIQESPFEVIGWGGLLMMLAMAALTVWLFAGAASRAVHAVVARPIRSLFVGIAALVAIPVASIILLVTIIGIPLGLLMLFGYGVLIIVAKVLCGVLAGALLAKLITKEYQVTYLWAFAGVIALALVKIIPVIGWIPSVLAFIALVGVVFTAVEHKLFRSESAQ